MERALISLSSVYLPLTALAWASLASDHRRSGSRLRSHVAIALPVEMDTVELHAHPLTPRRKLCQKSGDYASSRWSEFICRPWLLAPRSIGMELEPCLGP